MLNDQLPLLSYTEEIRALVQSERNEEALALCQHVLRYYPKHLDTYRLAAEATTENGDLTGAIELFRRVLSADPEHFVAYAGLGAIFDQQRQTDEAIWHLERANEIAPANLEIRQELLRLYAEIEDTPRARLKLTPGGLARLYVQEGLFAPAIQELRAIVDADPNRFDARVALAETLWRAGKIREAADVALHLLDPLPYCLKANLILGATFQETGLPEAEVYLKRAQEVDPTNQLAQKLFGARAPLEPAQAMVPRYTPGAPGEEPATTPAAPRASEPAIDLFSTAAENQPATVDLFEATPALSAPEPVKEDGGLPPWLRADFREKSQLPAALSKPTVKPTLGLKSALPPWLSELQKSLSESETEPTAPAWSLPRVSTNENAPAEQTRAFVQESKPAWLIETPAEEKPAAPVANELPDWLRAFQEQSAPAESSDAAREAEAETAIEEHAPIRLEDILPAYAEPVIAEPALPIVVEMPALAETQPAPKAKRKRQPRAYAHLLQARVLRDANRVEEALVEYEIVVQKGPRLVNQVIDDMKELITMWNPPLDAHRILGDAYTRADRLTDALERYRYVLERVSEP